MQYAPNIYIFDNHSGLYAKLFTITDKSIKVLQQSDTYKYNAISTRATP